MTQIMINIRPAQGELFTPTHASSQSQSQKHIIQPMTASRSQKSALVQIEPCATSLMLPAEYFHRHRVEEQKHSSIMPHIPGTLKLASCYLSKLEVRLPRCSD